MTKKYSTKKALVASMLSLALCFSMLIGTTFAWFTDSATSPDNNIQTGNLDVEMYWAKGTEDPASTTWTDASTGAIFDYDLWEPGYAQVRHIKIENKGTLALKYNVSIAANGTVSELADVIDVYYVDPAVQVADRAAVANATKLGTLAEVLSGIIADEAAIGMVNSKTTAVRIIPAVGMKVGDMVYNSQGIFPVQKVFKNGVQEIWDIIFEYENGSKTELSVTPNHKIKTKHGWKQVQELTTGDTVYLLKSSMEKHISSITEKDTFQEERKDFMSQYGNFTMAQSLKDSMFITKMKTHGIILSKILSAFKILNTYLCTFKKKCKILLSWKNLESEWITQEHTQANGTVAKKGLNGIKSTEKESQRTYSQENTPAYIAERNSGKSHSEKSNSALIAVNQLGEESKAMTMKQEFASTAVKNLQQTNTVSQNIVEEVAVKNIYIKSKREGETYNLMIKDVHEYIARNLLVLNCIDALRYVVYAECGGINNDENRERELSKEDLGIFM